jgi:uncharacterized protein
MSKDLGARFEVKKSGIDGRGLFATTRIPKGRKFGELAGELISQREATKRARSRQRIAIVEFGDGTALDASVGGNEFRFTNHSCSPNAYIRIIGTRVEFYALRDIRRGQEITCDYGETQHEGTRRCTCGSKECRAYL